MYDVLDNVPVKTKDCLDKGFVRLVDVMPRLVPEEQKTADYAIVQAARVSYGDGTKSVNQDRGLIRYLLRHNHTTPFEMVEFKFQMKLPVFIARQVIRHRTANVNEYSGRYSIMKDEFYYPEEDNVRQQSKVNKQGGDDIMEAIDAQSFLAKLDELCNSSYQSYTEFADKGVAREQARMMLPVNLYTEWYWKIDCWNLFHFLALRCDSHAQWEVRSFANSMLELIQPIIPWAVEAWNDYHPMRGAIKLTRLEVEALRQMLDGTVFDIETDNKREQAEWHQKINRIMSSEK